MATTKKKAKRAKNNGVKSDVSGWRKSESEIRESLIKAKEWIEQARLSAFGEGKNLFHFNKSLEIAIKHINACC
jgi:hypothetical protein